MARRWSVAAVVIVALGSVGAPAVAAAADHRAQTVYPGGRWTPPLPSYGVIAMKNVPVRMDDGAQLVADVYYPSDLKTGARARRRFPVLLTQTPYTYSIGLTSATSGAGPGDYFVQRGYIFVSVDVRGTGRSGGSGGFFSPRDARDGVELVHWVARLDGGNGVVGLTGCSYLGQTQLYTAALLGPRSPVKAMVPACVAGDVYRDTYLENGIPSPAWDGAGLAAGALLGPTIEQYMVGQYLNSQQGTAEAGDNAYYKEYWQVRDHVLQAPAVVRAGIPALLWDGWQEPGFGALELYAALQRAYFGRSPFTPLRPGMPATGRYQLILGDWAHGEGLDEGVMLQWFDTWLKHADTGMPIRTSTPIHVQELGSRRWVNVSSYPVVSRYTQYFFGGGTLAATPPKGGGADSVVWAQPTQPGSTVTYNSAPLARGATIAGPAAVTAYASSTSANIELMADLYDVAPDGSATKITHGGILGSLRATDAERSWTDGAGLSVRPYLSLQKDEAVPPGANRYDIPLHPKVWALLPGHALRLTMSTQADEQSCLESMQKIVWPVLGCKPRPAILAALAGGTYAIERGGVHASSITLPLLAARALPAARSSTTPTSGRVVLPRDW